MKTRRRTAADVGAGSSKDAAGTLATLKLRPMIRDRLLAVMDRGAIPPQARPAHLQAVTGRAPQCSRRWIDPLKPGLPDLEAFALLCLGFGMDANRFLGLAGTSGAVESSGGASHRRSPWAEADAWVGAIVGELSRNVPACRTMRMNGDDMEPVLSDGDLMFVDTGARTVAGNGVYVLEVGGLTMVRQVECRLDSLVLSCANERYEPCVLNGRAAQRKAGLRVAGKVLGGIGLKRFWRSA